MDTAWLAPHAVRPAVRDGQFSFDHHVLKRRAHRARPVQRRHPPVHASVRDVFETWHPRPRGIRFLARLTTLVLATLACADLIADGGALRQASWIAAVLVAGAAAMLAVA